MIVTLHMPNQLATYCRENEIAFIDTAENVFISTKRYETFICGLKPPKEVKRKAAVQATTASTGLLKAVFPLLREPELLNAQYREVVGDFYQHGQHAFDALKSRNMIGERRQERVWLEPARLFQEWVVGYATKLRPKMTPKRYMTDSTALWREVVTSPKGMMWGGEAAAEHESKVNQAENGALYFDSHASARMLAFMLMHRFRFDPEGNIEVLKAGA